MLLSLLDNNMCLVSYKDKDVCVEKYISADDFIKCISNSLNKKTEISTGFCPPGFISISITESQKYIVYQYPKLKENISYNGTEFKDFPLPAIVFGFFVNTLNYVSDVHIGVTELGVLSPDSKMYAYPFANVSGGNTDSKLCVGNSRPMKIERLTDLIYVAEHYMLLDNNEDYYSYTRSRLNCHTHISLLNNLSNKTSKYYYKKVLIENGLTLQDFINKGVKDYE